MNRKLKTTGFTIVELLTVIAVLAILLGVLMPALNMVKKMAKETKQKAQLNSIDIAVNVYRNDFGDYPPSDGLYPSYDYCGSNKLAEALVGYDLLGFHPDSIFNSNGEDENNNDLYPDDPDDDNLNKRKGPYFESEAAATFTLDDLFDGNADPPLDGERYLICDIFTFKKVNIPGSNKVLKAGTPILYYRAYTQKTDHHSGRAPDSRYNFNDNAFLIEIGDGKFQANIEAHEFYTSGSGRSAEFYEFIKDPVKSTSNRDWPVRMDTFLLISAGYDGRYGTSDDICNFEPNIE